MKLDNFHLEEYDMTSSIHKTVVIELENDRDGKYYLGNLEYQIEEINKLRENDIINQAYIAFYNEEAVGYISLSHKENRYEISYGIRPKYRGEHLGALLLQEFSEKVFEDNNKINELTLMICNQNTSSKKTASLAGYRKETSTKHIQKRL